MNLNILYITKEKFDFLNKNINLNIFTHLFPNYNNLNIINIIKICLLKSHALK